MENENKKLEVGEKYLSINIKLEEVMPLLFEAASKGEKEVNVAAFKFESDKPNAPKYRSKYASVFVNKKKDNENIVEEERI